MGPKPAKKKAAKPQEKKVARVLSAAQLEEDSEFDELEVIDRGADAAYETVEQLELSEEELNKDVTLLLKAENPYFSEEFVEFNFKDLEYKTVTSFPDTVIFFSQSGSLVHKSSEELHVEKAAAEKTEEGADNGEEPSEMLDVKRKNKFNFCDRAVQTMNQPQRDECFETEPPAQSTFLGNATLWDITLAYEAASQADVLGDASSVKTDVQRIPHGVRIEAENLPGLGPVAKIMERMVNQNKCCDIIIDFSYYDNPCDEFLEQGMGSVLPLWKFVFREMKGSTVKGITWNHHYPDMLAAVFGSNEFSHDMEGCICVYTLKNTNYPEKVYKFDTAVQCADFHRQWPHLLAAGFSDGSVAVFDLRHSSSTPIATSQNCKNGHDDNVSQVKWLADNVHEQHNFCSVSTDGKVINWILAKSELIPSDVMVLKNEECCTEGPESTTMSAVSGGTSVSFNADSTDLFLVGTEEGLIYACSCLYTDQYLSTYKDHSNMIYNVEWNPYHPRVFLSCSADWTIRIWDRLSQESVFIFDMFNEVKMATWAPFSSTLFAAVTKDKKLHVFDLMMNRQHPTCTYAIYGPKKHVNLSTVSINPKMPLVVVGDERGYVTSYKLSPNLRSSIKGLYELEKAKFIESEIDKMEKVLKLAKSPEPKGKQ